MPSLVKNSIYLILFFLLIENMKKYFFFFFNHLCYTAMGAKAQRRTVSYLLGPGTFLAIHKWMLIKQIDACNIPDQKDQTVE